MSSPSRPSVTTSSTAYAPASARAATARKGWRWCACWTPASDRCARVAPRCPSRDLVSGRYWAHPTAVVDRPAAIGAATKIWHFSHVMPRARIGARCTLGQNVFVGSRAVVGDGCRIQNNVSVYDGVELGDEVFVGPS